MKVDVLELSKATRIGIDKLVLSGIKVDSKKNSIITEGQGWIEEKVEVREELFSIVKSIKLYETGEVVEANFLRFNPNKVLEGHNIFNARAEELKEAVEYLLQELNSKGIQVDLSKARVSEIEINTNLTEAFEDYKEVLTLLFLGLPNLRKIGNHTPNLAYKKLFTDSTLDGGWQSHGVRAYDKKREVGDEKLLNSDLLRIEWWLTSSSYKYYANKFGRDNTLEALLEDSEILDEIFVELCLRKLFEEAYRHLESEIIPNLERGYLRFKGRNKLAREKGKSQERNVLKYLEENYWIFDYSYLIDLVGKHDKKNKVREIKRIRDNYFHLNNKEKLSYLMENIFPH